MASKFTHVSPLYFTKTQTRRDTELVTHKRKQEEISGWSLTHKNKNETISPTLSFSSGEKRESNHYNFYSLT